jgi:hypothetical protein
MFRASFWWRLVVAVLFLFLLIMSQPLTMSSHMAFAQASSVNVNPTQGPPGTTVTGTGSNWAAGDQMQISWADDGSTLANTTIQSEGTFTANFKIPSNAGQGGRNIYFTDLTGHYFLPAVFTVTAKASAPPPSSSPTVIVQKVFTADSNNNPLTTFAPGDAIHYRVDAQNTSSTSVTATVTYLATGPQQIYSWSGSASLASGPLHFYSAPTIPKNAPTGPYTITVTITANGVSSSEQGQFTIKQSAGGSLNVPYYSQYAGQPLQNADCGPASVAMVLSYYQKGPGGDGNAMQQIRNKMSAPGAPAPTGDTFGANIENALSAFNTSYAEVPRGAAGSVPIQAMEQRITQKQPLIVLIHGADIGRGVKYGDHWVVVTGFSSDGQTVYLNDPDNQHPRSAGWIQGGQISLSTSLFQTAITNAQAEPIIAVTG